MSRESRKLQPTKKLTMKNCFQVFTRYIKKLLYMLWTSGIKKAWNDYPKRLTSREIVWIEESHAWLACDHWRLPQIHSSIRQIHSFRIIPRPHWIEFLNFSIEFCRQSVNKLTSVFHVPVLLLIMNLAIKLLVKVGCGSTRRYSIRELLWQCYDEIHCQ